MILTGTEIKSRMGGDISIEPYEESHLNTKGYDLTLHNELLVYEEVVLDIKEPNRHRKLEIPESGLVLSPNQVYLGRTVEHTETHNLLPSIEGRSSLSRLGLFVHPTAGLGDAGFRGFWTLEMFAVQPIRIYPGIKICQLIYHTLCGEIEEYASDKYQNNHGIQPSLLYREFGRTEDDQQLKFEFPTQQ
ncbi:MAG: dCTP deaminase [Planctomycetota bacterium]